jgi:hypothetical protein
MKELLKYECGRPIENLIGTHRGRRGRSPIFPFTPTHSHNRIEEKTMALGDDPAPDGGLVRYLGGIPGYPPQPKVQMDRWILLFDRVANDS